MVQAMEDEMETNKPWMDHLNVTLEEGGRQARSMIVKNSGSMSPVESNRVMSRSYASASLKDYQQPKIGSPLEGIDNNIPFASERSTSNPVTRECTLSPDTREKRRLDMEMMKERFAKMLLGEDMSGGGKGVASALALSNAITNLAASVFGEQKRLEPMSAETKARWRKELDWLLSVTDHIVEFVPSQQKSKDGTNMEIMTTRQRTDLHMNIPALHKLDAMLLECLDNFKDQHEFYYPKHDDESQKGTTPVRHDNKWWIPTPKVPPNGLSEATRKWLQYQKYSVTQVLKAVMAINAQILAEMEIPESYIESLPKSGRATLGDMMYRSITDEFFDPDIFLTSIDLSSEHKIVDLKNKLEALVVIWKRKLNAKDNRSSWSSGVSAEKRELFEERAKTILLLLKQKFPGLPQSNLDIFKIQFNRDVGHAILESYSRVIESLAFTVLSRIEDVMHADYLARSPMTTIEQRVSSLKVPQPLKASHKTQNATEYDSVRTPTLLDVMGWKFDGGDKERNKDTQDETDVKQLAKLPNIITDNKVSYIQRLESSGGVRSPTARH